MSGKFSRRQFAKLAGLAALGMAAASANAANPKPKQAVSRGSAAAGFPKNFAWGTATSAYQIEGAVDEDGRGRSIWDVFAHTPGKIEDNSTGDRANEHYHRYKEDVRLIRDLGVRHYRFSIAWPRVFPDGTGAPNPKGLDFYNRLIDEIASRRHEPYATLYHWDLPQALQERVGGWQSSDTSKAFADYAGHVAARLTDRVKNIFTLNEAGRFLNFGYGWGIDAPGLKLPAAELNQARHNVVLGHGLAVQAIRARGRAGTKVGPAEKHRRLRAGVRHAENVRAAEHGDARTERRPARRHAGGQIHRRLPRLCRQGRAEVHRRGIEDHRRKERLCRPQHLCAAILHRRFRQSAGLVGAAVPRLVSAHGLGMAADRSRDDLSAAAAGGKVWNIETIYISENGTSSEDKLHADGKVYDLDRIMYLCNYLRQLQRAVAEGCRSAAISCGA